MICNKLSFLIIIIAMFSISSCNINCVEAKGPVTTENRDMETYNEISVEIPANIRLVPGDVYNLTITAPESYQRAITSEVRRNKLVLKGDVCNADNSDIEITLTLPTIPSVIISGSADLYSDVSMNANDIDLKIAGSGNIHLNLISNQIQCKIDGSGNILLSGTCQNLKAVINGSGNFKGLGLNSFTADIKINGSGNASIFALNKLNAKINGSGEIIYSGEPDINMGISGSGRISKAN